MSYVKHPAPWIGAILFLLTALSDAERDYSIPFAVVVGAAAGVMSGKNKKTTTFVLEYSDGHRETKTVKNGSKEYNQYCTLLERRL